MKDLQNTIQTFLSNHERRKKYIFVLIALSLLVIFVVTISLIMPAISMTDNSIDNNNYVQLGMSSNDTEIKVQNPLMYGFNTVQGDTNENIIVNSNILDVSTGIITVPDNALDISSKITDESSITPTDDGSNLDERLIEFLLAYKLGPKEISVDKSTIKYKLPDNIKLGENDYFYGDVEDEEGIISGTYYIGKTSDTGEYYVVIEFNHNYLNEHQDKLNSYGLEGTLKFNAIATRGDDIGDVNVDIGNGVNATIPFELKKWDINKSGSLDKSTNTITWTLKIFNNDTKKPSLKDYTITDEMFNQAIDGSIEINPNNLGSLKGNKYTFNQDYNGDVVTITYKTKVSSNTDKEENVATIDNGITGDNNYNKQVKVPVDIPKKVDISKSYELDYKVDGIPKNQVVWTITVTNNYPTDIKDYIITDDKFIGATDFTINNESITNPSGNQLTIPNLPMGDTKITYRTDYVPNDTNEVTGEDNVSSKVTVTSDYNPFGFKKDGQVSSDRNYIEWTITVNGNDNANINGMVVNDPQMTSENISYISYGDNEWSVKELESDELNKLKSTVQNGSLTLNFGENTNVHSAKIKYKTPITDEDKTYAIEHGLKEYNNSATFTYDGTQYGQKDANASYNPKNQMTKKLDKSTKDTENSNIRLLDWLITIDRDKGFNNTDELIDIMNTSNSKFGHYITDSQINNIKITAYNDTNTEGTVLTKGVNYTISYDETENTQFSIKFLEMSGYNKVVIKYQTTANLEGATIGDKISFENRASYDDLTVKDPPHYDEEIIDTNKKSFTKYALNGDGTIIENSNIQTIDRLASELPKQTINGTEYYIFGYKISCDEFEGSSVNVLKDTLPDGFTVYDDNDEYAPYYIPVGQKIIKLIKGNQYGGYTIDNDNTLNINITWTFSGDVYYYLKISVDDFNAKYLTPQADGTLKTIKNTVSSDGKEAIQNQTITNDITYVTDDSLLDKTASPSRNKSEITYSVIVNPNADILSNDGTISLTDILSSGNYSNKNGENTKNIDDDKVHISLKNIEIDEIDSAGNSIKLDNSQYQYTFQNPSNDDTYFNQYNNKAYTVTDSNYIYALGLIEKNSVVSVTIYGTPNSTLENCYIMGGGEWNKQIANLSKMKFDNNGKLVCNFIASMSEDDGQLYTNGYFLRINKYVNNNVAELKDIIDVSKGIDWSVTQQEINTASLKMTVPDGKKLLIKYTYSVDDIDGITPEKDSKLQLSNNISLKTKNYVSNSSADSYVILNNSSSATSRTQNYPTIEKVDTNDYTIKLSATFRLSKWDSTKSSWVYADISQDTDNTGKIYHKIADAWLDTPTETSLITTSSSSEQYRIDLQDDTLYRLEEITPPTGYLKLTSPIYFVYDTSNINDILGSSGIQATQVNKILFGKSLQIKNNKLISITANKSWSDNEKTSHDTDTITLQLYKSTQKVTDGFPNILIEVDNPVTISKANNWTYTWNNLEDGDENQRPLYYYVKEISYNINGTEYNVNKYNYYVSSNDNTGSYKAYYTKNNLDDNYNQVIDIVNSNGLEVTKLWNGGSSSVPEIEFQLLNSTTNEVISVNGETTFKLNDSNNWKYIFENLSPDINYTVKEITEVPNYKSTIVNNSTGNTGTIKIVNTYQEKTSISVKKVWDSNQSVKPNITLTLQQKIGSTGKWSNYTSDNYDSIITLKDGTTSYDFKNLPSADDNGNVIYYRVVETPLDNYVTKYSINQEEGIKGGSITITNTLDNSVKGKLKIVKIWQGVGNTQKPSEIKVDIYRTITKLLEGADNPSIEKFQNVDTSNMEYVTTVTLTDINGTYQVEKSLPLSDSDNNPYYYYIKEQSVENFMPFEYSNNGATLSVDTTVEISVSNTLDKRLTISKNWSDGNENHRTASEKIYFVIYRSIEENPTVDFTEIDNNSNLSAITSTNDVTWNNNISNIMVITPSDDWSIKINNLDAKDNNGNYYNYYIHELPTNTAYNISYSPTSIKLDTSNPVITIHNTKQDKSTILPSTGGTGTSKYYVVGSGLIFISILMLVKKRRDI